jgi:hypothetical protein
MYEHTKFQGCKLNLICDRNKIGNHSGGARRVSQVQLVDCYSQTTNENED